MVPDPGLRRAAVEAGLRITEWTPSVHRDLRSRSGRLRLVEWGRPMRPVVLFLHGGGQTSSSWELVAQSLSSDARCIALDLPGHGESEWLQDAWYRATVIANVVGDALATVDVQPDVVVGASLGGLVGACLASRNRSVRALAMLDVGPESLGRGIEAIRRFLERASGRSSIEEYVREARRFNPRRSSETLRFSLKANLRRTADGLLTWKYDPRVFEPLEPMVLTDEKAALRAAMARLKCPVLIVRGEASEILTRAETISMAESSAKVEAVEVLGAGHTVHGDQPASVVWALGTFMQRHVGLGSRWMLVCTGHRRTVTLGPSA